MADEETGEVDGAGEAPTKSKGSIKLLGAVVGLIALGSVLAMVAMPKKEKVKSLVGPAMHRFFPEGEIVGNPLDDNFSRYIKFSPSCSYFAYDPAYPAGRSADEHYETALRESMIFTISQYRIDEIMASAAHEAFAAALEEVAEPVLFPVHLGETQTPYDQDPKSGLRLGDSQDQDGTFRGAFYEHELKVDAKKKTLQLDELDPVSFSGTEHDLLVEAEDGSKFYVDVTGIKDGFEGTVHVGVMGRIRRMYTGDIIAQ